MAAPTLSSVTVASAGHAAVNGCYAPQDAQRVPAGFAFTCDSMEWDADEMWERLSDLSTPWYEMENGSYIYRNRLDGKWWIDAPSGEGVYIARSDALVPPTAATWAALDQSHRPLPRVSVTERSRQSPAVPSITSSARAGLSLLGTIAARDGSRVGVLRDAAASPPHGSRGFSHQRVAIALEDCRPAAHAGMPAHQFIQRCRALRLPIRA